MPHQESKNEARTGGSGLNAGLGVARTAADTLAALGVFKGAHGLEGLLHATEFWNRQPYGSRLYYGDGQTDYLHIDVLRAAVHGLTPNDLAKPPGAAGQAATLGRAMACKGG